MTDCVFCKIVGGEIPSTKVWEDGRFLAFLDINPINPGHTLVIPKSHEGYIFDMGEQEYLDILKAAKSLAGAVREATGAKRIGVIVEGFLVPHVHIHLVPINAGGELSFSRQRKASPEELAGMAEKVRSAIQQ